MTIPTLIIDDNRRYTAMLKDHLEKQGCLVEHILSYQEGLKHLRNIDSNHYQLIITDITMETQISGIILTWQIRHLHFDGCLIIYSTGFNFPMVLGISRLFFHLLGADGLIPKNGLKTGNPRLTLISKHPLLKLVEKAFVSENISQK
jgi:CheY-like chemotaxis protein